MSIDEIGALRLPLRERRALHEEAPDDPLFDADLADAPSPRLPLTDDRAWGVDDVAYFLNISESLVRKLERERRLPALPRIGRRLNFDPKIVRAFRENPDAPELRAVNGGR